MAINPLFNAQYYLAHNEDLVRAGLHTDEQLWDHYVQYGAQESLSNANLNAFRAPNAWFNIDYYLQANPDLLAGGVTAPTALDHFLTYGISENREFNKDLSISDFDFVDYAAKNADLREAFGIEEDFSVLTAEQKTELLTHYLSYGYAENRKGAGDDFNDILAAKNIINIEAASDKLTGTIVDDEFRVKDAVANTKTIDGLGGNDTVVLNGAADVTGLKLQNIEELVVNNTAATIGVESKKILDKVTLGKDANAVTVKFDAAAVNGSADVLNVANNATAGDLTVSGIETVNVALGKDVTAFTLQANEAKGSVLTVNLTGGKEDTAFAISEFNTTSSTRLTDIVFDGTGLAGGFNSVKAIDQALKVETITVKGSNAAVNTFSVTGPTNANNLVLEAGSKGDTFKSSDAIDTFVAGRGGDTFTITAGESLVRVNQDKTKVVAFDTIKDFGANDKVVGTGVNAIETASVVTSETAFYAMLGDSNKEKSAFEYDGDTYVLLTAAANAGDYSDVAVIKLAGIAIDELKVDGANLVLA